MKNHLLLSIVLLSSAIVFFSLSRKESPAEMPYRSPNQIKVEYYLEVSEDSIWIQGVQSGNIYSGKYSDLDSLISMDNI
jgi:hypothetical protein